MLDTFTIFDSHFHIIDDRYPLIPNNGYLPSSFNCRDYIKRTSQYKLSGGAIVSGSFQAFDQHYLINALNTLGENYVGVTQLPPTVSDEEILQLDRQRIRAIRFNLKRGGSAELGDMVTMANRIYDLVKWHIELYIDSSELTDLYPTLLKLPSVSIDHLGLSQSGFKTLLKLAEKNVKVKATGFGRVDFDIENALKDIYKANPTALMFGTDLPSTRAPSPYSDRDIERVINALGEQAAKSVFSENALAFYLKKTPSTSL